MPQPHGAGLAAGDAADRGLGGGGLAENDLRAGEQFGAGAGQGDLAGGAGGRRISSLSVGAAMCSSSAARPKCLSGYRHDVELRQLEAFGAVATELLPAGRMRRAWPNSAFASCLFFGSGHGVRLAASVAGTPAAAGLGGDTR